MIHSSVIWLHLWYVHVFELINVYFPSTLISTDACMLLRDIQSVVESSGQHATQRFIQQSHYTFSFILEPNSITYPDAFYTNSYKLRMFADLSNHQVMYFNLTWDWTPHRILGHAALTCKSIEESK